MAIDRMIMAVEKRLATLNTLATEKTDGKVLYTINEEIEMLQERLRDYRAEKFDMETIYS